MGIDATIQRLEDSPNIYENTGYGIEPYKPGPSERRTGAVAKMLVGLGYDERRAYQMATKITDLGENIAEMTPLAMDLAEERGEPPLNMSLLSAMPGAMVARRLASKAMELKRIDNSLYELNSKMNERPGEFAYKRWLRQKDSLEARRAQLIRESRSQPGLPGVNPAPVEKKFTAAPYPSTASATIQNVGEPGLTQGLYNYRGYAVERVGKPSPNAKWKIKTDEGDVIVPSPLDNAKINIDRIIDGKKAFRIPIRSKVAQEAEGIYVYRGYTIQRRGPRGMGKDTHWEVTDSPVGPVPPEEFGKVSILGILRDRIDKIIGPEYLKKGGLIMNYGDYGRNYK